MSTSFPSQRGAFWSGVFAAPANLPGVASAEINLKLNDFAFVTGGGVYQCTNPAFPATWVAASAGGSGVVGPSNAVYVDPAGNDATGTRGNFALPFLTIEAAFAVTQDGDEVLIAPGLYSPLVALTPPGGVTHLVVRGSGPAINTDPAGATAVGGTTISQANIATDYVFDFINVMDYVLLESFTVATVSGGFGIRFDGSTSAGLFGLNGIFVNDVWAALSASYVNQLSWRGGHITDSCLVDTCSDVVFTGMEITPGINIDWDDADANKPTTPRVDVLFKDVSINGSVAVLGQASVTLNRASRMTTIQGNSLTTANGLALSFRCYGRVDGDIDFFTAGKRFPDTAVALVVDFDGALLQGAAIDFRVDGAPPANRQTVTMRNATVTVATIQAGAAVDIDAAGIAQGINVNAIATGTPLGTFNRSIGGFFAFSGGLVGAAVVLVTNYLANTGQAVAVSATAIKYPVGRACWYTRLTVSVTVNPLATATTFTVYVNGAATAMAVTFGAGVTGLKTNLVNTSQLAATDTIDLVATNTAGGAALTLLCSATLEMV